MKRYNEVAVRRVEATIALLSTLPEVFTAKEFNEIREKVARKNSGERRMSFRYIPRDYVGYTLKPLRDVGAIIIDHIEQFPTMQEVMMYEVDLRGSGEILFKGSGEDCEAFIKDDWKHLGMCPKDWEECEVMVNRHHYKVDMEAFRQYLHSTFDM